MSGAKYNVFGILYNFTREFVTFIHYYFHLLLRLLFSLL